VLSHFLQKTNIYSMNGKRSSENEQRLSALDKKMKKIMNMRNISDDKKWILYKQQLTKALNIKK